MQQQLSIVWQKFTGEQGSLLFNPSEFKDQWLFGIPLCNNVTGQPLSDSTIQLKILAAQEKLENELGIKIFQQCIYETKDFVREEFMQWGFVKTSWQILKIVKLSGNLNNESVIEYPHDWLTIRKSNSNDNTTFKELYIVPNGNSSLTFSYLLVNYPTLFSFYGARTLPNYWKIQYITGFKRIPNELIDLVGLISAIYILPMIEMIVGGVNGRNFGAASNSLSLDGLSQSVSRANGGNIFQQRMKEYNERLKSELKSAKGIFGGLTFDMM